MGDQSTRVLISGSNPNGERQVEFPDKINAPSEIGNETGSRASNKFRGARH